MIVCVIKYTERGDEKSIAQIIPAAGSFVDRPLEAKTSLLTTAGSEDVEGVVLEFKGQVYNDKRQRTVIELSCDHSVEVPRPPRGMWLTGRLEVPGLDRLMRVFCD
jgi:hypothetical protein